MRKKLVVGNWKMNLGPAEALSLVEAIESTLSSISKVDVAVCPTFLALVKVGDRLKRSQIALGAQDCFWVDQGAFTGQISAKMLAAVGVKMCIVGHSETRGRFGKLEIHTDSLGLFAETDFTVNLKIKALLFQSVIPVVCVGESFDERNEGQTDEVVRQQLLGALEGIDGVEFQDGVIAYEPVWAIGTGAVCDPEEASRVCTLIRTVVGEIFDEETAEKVRVLYGGSVKASNAHDIFSQANVDGGLVGGASLIVDEFTRIVLSAS